MPGNAIYMPVVHGIGVRSAAAWAEESIERLVDWWGATGRGRRQPCGDGCALGAGHAHLALRGRVHSPARADRGGLDARPTDPETRRDALAWSSDGDARTAVAEHVQAVVSARGHRRVLLPGHSQGGSIVTELEPSLRRRRRQVRLVTFGTGHGLLVAMHRLLPGWGIWRSAILWPALVAYAVGVLLLLLSSTVLAVGDGLPLLTSLVRGAAIPWFADLDPEISAAWNLWRAARRARRT